MNDSAFDWLEDESKFALLALAVPIGEVQSRKELAPGVCVVAGPPPLDSHWKCSLGELFVEELAQATLTLAIQRHSNSAGLIDGESTKLLGQAGNWHLALQLVECFEDAIPAIVITGGRDRGQVILRQVCRFGMVWGGAAARLSTIRIGTDQLEEAAQVYKALAALDQNSSEGAFWRLRRCIDIYKTARAYRDPLVRIHQFVRCIEGLIAPSSGNTRRQFKSRTELFVGSKHHDLMGKLYEVRSKVEHLHEDELLVAHDRAARIRLLELDAIAEWIARSTLERILTSRKLWCEFKTKSAIATFWEREGDSFKQERQSLWGDTINPDMAILDLNFALLTDEELGIHARPAHPLP